MELMKAPKTTIDDDSTEALSSQQEAANGIDAEYRTGSTSALLVLCTVPLAGGTFEPAVRLVYQLKDPAIPGFLFGLSYYLVATVALGIIDWLNGQSRGNFTKNGGDYVNHLSDDSVMGSMTISTTTVAGVELGTYLFVGNALQVLGLQTIASDRAAFLLQLTTIFVPIVDAFVRRQWISRTVAFASGVALIGVAFLTLEVEPAVLMDQLLRQDSLYGSSGIMLAMGDVYVILAAVCYTFHCLRLADYAERVPNPIALALSKARTELFWSLLAVAYFWCATTTEATLNSPSGWDQIVQEQGLGIHTLFERVVDVVSRSDNSLPIDEHALQLALGAILWTGLVPVAYTILAQSYGQRYVSAITANLIYTLQPLATALVAYLLLQEATLTSWGYLGGLLLGVSVVLVVTMPPVTTTEKN